jgi:hypothetical protein
VLPPSTVLGGEPGQGSESISKVWELLQDTYDLENRELTGIHNSVKDLNANIMGLVTSILRTGGVSGMALPGSERGIGESITGGLADVQFLNLAMLGFGKQIAEGINKVLGFGSKTFEGKEGGIKFGAAYLNDDYSKRAVQTVNDFLNGLSVAAVKSPHRCDVQQGLQG